MGHGTDKHLEHAEHTQHAAHNPFDSRVAMTMAILAAVLAGVTLTSHRGHTETLRLANEATALHTKASDKWNEYQAVNIRTHEYRAHLTTEYLLARDGLKHDPEADALRNYWISQLEKYEGAGAWARFKEDVLRGKAKKDKEPADSHGAPKEDAHGSSKSESPKAVSRLQETKAEAEKLQKEGHDKEHESHHLHELVTWIDVGHLGLELALVFCAVSVLTKSRKFWTIGVSVGVIGTGVALYGIIMWRFFFDTPGAGGH
jgi:hypothetical protein